jgi:hypothetical protein
MIGQTHLLENIDLLIQSKFPRFIILEGEKGSGRKTIAKEIARRLNARAIVSEIKAEEVRNTINLAYKVYTPTVYILPEADKMHKSAKNALLKVTEEPPLQAYFILTTNDLGRMLDTLISRGTILKMDKYSRSEKLDYIKLNYAPESTNGNSEYLVEVCDTFTEIDLLFSYGIEEFKNFCNTTADFVCKAGLANVLKIPKKLKLKEEDPGYEPSLFLKSVAYCFSLKMLETSEEQIMELFQLMEYIKITLNYISELNITGIHKLSTLDAWILEMRGL